jgi:hypothetical protein
MQHAEAVRAMAGEKYLLDELTPEQREEFEDHFFGCPECAMDVRAGATFLEHSKILLSEPANEATAAAVPTYLKWWFGWLRPAITVPVMALLLVVVAYQGLFTQSKAKSTVAEFSTPQILPSASLVSARSDKIPAVAVRPNRSFLLFVDIPSDNRFASYICELDSPTGAVEWSLPISTEMAQNTLPLQVPAGQAIPGTYTLVVRGLASNGSNVVLARYPFELQVQN